MKIELEDDIDKYIVPLQYVTLTRMRVSSPGAGKPLTAMSFDM